MYDYEAKRMAKRLNERVPGKLSASEGPGPVAFVTLQIERWPLMFNAQFMSEAINTQVLSDDGKAVAWGIKTYPNTAEGAERAADELADWLDKLPS